jgi:hypothetical protein
MRLIVVWDRCGTVRIPPGKFEKPLRGRTPKSFITFDAVDQCEELCVLAILARMIHGIFPHPSPLVMILCPIREKGRLGHLEVFVQPLLREALMTLPFIPLTSSTPLPQVIEAIGR